MTVAPLEPSLQPSPFDPSWVLRGSPEARVATLAAWRGRTQAALWDCTAGSFRWQFGPYDETVHILEGEVTVTLLDGSERVLRPGDVALFPAGTTSVWVVSTYVKKVAVLHDTRSRVRRAAAHLLGRIRPARAGGL
jgi:uncharacterized cupin superfamily protein